MILMDYKDATWPPEPEKEQMLSMKELKAQSEERYNRICPSVGVDGLPNTKKGLIRALKIALKEIRLLEKQLQQKEDR